ncbi:MAG TPA: VanZ family protein [Desulfosporosinus sp.]|nr:VanZ family protein [Desulfosporosinus sp.]
MSSRKFWWSLVISWCILIFMLTALPAFTATHTGVVLEHATQMPVTQVGSANLILRKCTHVTLFGILAVLLYKATGLNIQLAWIMATLYGASDEIHQLFVPGRGSAMQDVAFDSFGAFLLLGVVVLIKRLTKDPKLDV